MCLKFKSIKARKSILGRQNWSGKWVLQLCWPHKCFAYVISRRPNKKAILSSSKGVRIFFSFNNSPKHDPHCISLKCLKQ